MSDAATLQRRFANFRREHAGADPRSWPGLAAGSGGRPELDRRAAGLAGRLAAGIDGEVVETDGGRYVRREQPAVILPIDRPRLATLPGQPLPETKLVCLDTETTGLATAAGTLVFLVGLGWWEGDRFRQVQLLLPDQADEPAFLSALAELLPRDAWLVTYNGRAFDWPLLVTRFRMARRAPPPQAGHLDLLTFVRRIFRHRLSDARLRTVERELLDVRRPPDVEGWEIPGRYLDFLRGGPADGLIEVARHNEEDVRSLGRILVHVAERYGDPDRRRAAPRGDLACLARYLSRDGRHEEALDCLETALARDEPIRDPFGRSPTPAETDDPWWSPRRAPDFGGRTRPRTPLPPTHGDRGRLAWSHERVGIERARLLRRLDRVPEAVVAWQAIAAGGGLAGIAALVEVAKLLEHRMADPSGALDAVERAQLLAERRRRLGWPASAVERELADRAVRLRRRISRTNRARLDRSREVSPPVG